MEMSQIRLLVKFIFLGIIIVTNLNCNSTINNETITIVGTIGNSFHLSSTHKIEKHERKDLWKEVKPFLNKIEKLDRYYSYLNSGKEHKANEILKSDSTLSKTNQFGIGISYMMAKMKELNILYLPLIQSSNLHDSHLISISEKELILLNEYLGKKIEIELEIEKIGYIEMDETNIYKLRRINQPENNSQK